MAKLIHFMIRVLEAERSKTFYEQCFALKEAHSLDFSDFSLHYLRNEESGTELELTVNKSRTEPYDLGDGYGHMAVVVDDLDATHARIQALGYAPNDIVEFSPEQVVIARFFFMRDPDGYEIEVLQKQGHYQ